MVGDWTSIVCVSIYTLPDEVSLYITTLHWTLRLGFEVDHNSLVDNAGNLEYSKSCDDHSFLVCK